MYGINLGLWPGTSEANAVALIQQAYDLGITLFLVEVYSQSVSEQFFGKAVKPFGHKKVVATMFGIKEHDSH